MVAGHQRSEVAQLVHGEPEGRRSSPLRFAAAASGFHHAFELDAVGVGLDPPRDAVHAYHMERIGEEGTHIESNLVLHALQQVQSGDSWQDVMRTLPDDSSRLWLLDLASEVRVGLLQYLDDNEVKFSSWASGAVAADSLHKAAVQMGAEFKLGKGASVFQSRGMRRQAPIPCGEGCIAWSSVIQFLGCPRDADLSSSSLLKKIEKTALNTWHPLLTAVFTIGLPGSVCLAAYQHRVLPRALFASEIVILRGDWAARMDALQDKMIRMLFSVDASCARVRLILEAGVTWRLSSLVRRRVLALEARIALLPVHHVAKQVLTAGGSMITTWATAV